MTLPERPARPSVLISVGWAVLFLALGFLLMLALSIAGAALFGGADGLQAGPRGLIIQTASGLLAYGLMTWVVGMRGARLTLTDLRWAPMTQAGRGMGLGLLLGAGAAAFALALSLVAGGARFLPDGGTLPDYLAQVGRTGLLLAPAALLEEVMFRGVAQVVLARALGRVAAVLVLSVLFAMAHLANPNSSALGLVNIALAGVFLGLTFYAPGGIWSAWGAHLGWNAALAASDAPVSGMPFQIPLIDYAPGGPIWLTGGSFGPEGGLLATVAIVLATATAWRWARKELA
ncbi:MAG: CPBP family intramembrane glutamic endopeptidase [Gemmatimonadales bacterium]